jgi:1-acyl-sn-glycerol-3-phosphate acyltransferase
VALFTDLARLSSQRLLPAQEVTRLQQLRYTNAGHGYDAFGLHPDVVAFGEALVSPLYDRYFRVRSVGHENIPADGPAILAANHSGALPVDGMMLWCDVLRHTNPPRVVRAIADHFVPMIPLIGTLFARGGMVGGSRGNAWALLDNGEILMIFPEGVPGIAKHFKDRYKLQEWRVGHVELAIRHGCPVIPVGIVGPEEQMPQIGRIPISFAGLPFIPITLTPLPLPVRYHIYYGAPVNVHQQYRPDQADEPAAVREAAGQVRAAVEALLARGLAERPGIFS